MQESALCSIFWPVPFPARFEHATAPPGNPLMTTALKHLINRDTVVHTADHLHRVWPDFDRQRFIGLDWQCACRAHEQDEGGGKRSDFP